VIAGGEDVRAKFEEVFADCRGHPETSGSVLNIDHEEFDIIGFDQMMHVVTNDFASGTSKDIADK
jgi:hypothetical protein